MADPETLQNVRNQNEEFERKYFGEEHPDGQKLVHDILVKRMQSIGGKQFFDSGDYNREHSGSNKNEKRSKSLSGKIIPTVNEPAYAHHDKSPPMTRLSPKGRRLSSCSGSSIADSTGCDSGCGPEQSSLIKPINVNSQIPFQASSSLSHSSGTSTPPHQNSNISQLGGHHGSNFTAHQPTLSQGFPHLHHSHSHGSPGHHGSHFGHHLAYGGHGHHHMNSGSQSPTHIWQHHHHGSHNLSSSSGSSHYSPIPSGSSGHNMHHMSPLHINTEYSKPVRRLSSTSSCGEPSPLANDGLIHTCFKRPPIPGMDGEHVCDSVQISLHSPHSPCNLSFRGRSPSSTHFSTCLSDVGSCRNSPINVGNPSQDSREYQDSHDGRSIDNIDSNNSNSVPTGGLSMSTSKLVSENNGESKQFLTMSVVDHHKVRRGSGLSQVGKEMSERNQKIDEERENEVLEAANSNNNLLLTEGNAPNLESTPTKSKNSSVSTEVDSDNELNNTKTSILINDEEKQIGTIDKAPSKSKKAKKSLEKEEENFNSNQQNLSKNSNEHDTLVRTGTLTEKTQGPVVEYNNCSDEECDC